MSDQTAIVIWLIIISIKCSYLIYLVRRIERRVK